MHVQLPRRRIFPLPQFSRDLPRYGSNLSTFHFYSDVLFFPPVQKRAKASLQTKVRRAEAGRAATEAGAGGSSSRLSLRGPGPPRPTAPLCLAPLNQPRFEPGRKQSSMSAAGVIKSPNFGVYSTLRVGSDQGFGWTPRFVYGANGEEPAGCSTAGAF